MRRAAAVALLLLQNCAALRQRKVTHVVSVLSADQRRLPEFIKQHLYVRVDDTEEAADTLVASVSKNASEVSLASSETRSPPPPRAAAAEPVPAR